VSLREKIKEVKKDTVGVYFLYKDENCVYIGQSLCVRKRVMAHFRSTAIAFDNFDFIVCEPSQLSDLEAEHIAFLAPPYNGNLPSNSIFVEYKMEYQKYNLEFIIIGDRMYVKKSDVLKCEAVVSEFIKNTFVVGHKWTSPIEQDPEIWDKAIESIKDRK